MKKRLFSILFGLLISICYLQPSNVEAEEDYRQKIVLNHTDQTFPLEDLDVNYLTQIKPNIVVELKEKYTETETYYKDLLKRTSVKDSEIDAYLENSSRLVKEYYCKQATTLLSTMGCKEKIFTNDYTSSFLTISEDSLINPNFINWLVRLAKSKAIARIYIDEPFEDSNSQLYGEPSIQPYGWFGSWDGETLPSINGVATKNGNYHGQGVKVALVEAAMTDKALLNDKYPNLNVFLETTNDNISNLTNDRIFHAKCDGAIIAAIAPKCDLYSFFYTSADSCGPWFNKVVNAGCDIVNCSWGHKSKGYNYAFEPGLYCYYEKELDEKIVTHKKTVVWAVGNDGNVPGCPSNALNVISVGATDNNVTTKANYSNVGGNKPDIAANGAPHIPYISDPFHTNYGTSFAAPMVTAALADLLSKNPSLKLYPEKLAALLYASADLKKMQTDSAYRANGMSSYFGSGMLDVDGLLGSSDRAESITYHPTSTEIKLGERSWGNLSGETLPLRAALVMVNKYFPVTDFQAPQTLRIPTFKIVVTDTSSSSQGTVVKTVSARSNTMLLEFDMQDGHTYKVEFFRCAGSEQNSSNETVAFAVTNR